MSRQELATHVHVADEHDKMHVFGPGQTVPAWAAAKITNPKAWKGGNAPTVDEDPVAEVARLRARIAELESTPPDGGAGSGSAGNGDQDGPPPRGGSGSGAPAWRDYARGKGVDVADDASREDVIAALDAAGVRSE